MAPVRPKQGIRTENPSKLKFLKLLNFKVSPVFLQTKWGLVCENLINSCRVMPDKPFLACLPQN